MQLRHSVFGVRPLRGGIAPSLLRLPAVLRGVLHGFAPPTSERLAAEYVFPFLRPWWAIVDRLRLGDADAVKIAFSAERNRTNFGAEARACGLVTEQQLAAALAMELDLPHQQAVDPRTLLVSEDQALQMLRHGPDPLFVRAHDGVEACILAATDRVRGIGHALEAHPRLRRVLRIAPFGRLRAALLSRASASLARRATFDLVNTYPDYSSQRVFHPWQGSVVGALGLALPLIAYFFTAAAFLALHVFSTLFFLACVSLRFCALARLGPARRPDEIAQPADMPVYSILVALYREADVVGDLIAALRKLDWPKSKLDVKLVCEADDHETIAAIRATRPPEWMEIIPVPDFGPRTKPKALNYALHACRGEFVALYDAEDKPHPGQLIEAWQTFRRVEPTVACLQAPLVITNGAHGWIARMFAFEYVALFRGLLPWLSARGLLLPLGGTSNHFRREALEHVGAWDPFNVTEDADLGTRLVRFGYSTRTISLPTLEEAPENARVWIPQRTRWFKGWMVSWLVHMRSPARLYAELGLGSFTIVQVLFAGMAISALVHPILVLTILILSVQALRGDAMTTYQSALLLLDIVNIVGSYTSFWLLGWYATEPGERGGVWPVMTATVPYWLMMSFAAWRSVFQLYRRPHLWEKTPHGKESRRASPTAEPSQIATDAGIQASECA